MDQRLLVERVVQLGSKGTLGALIDGESLRFFVYLLVALPVYFKRAVLTFENQVVRKSSGKPEYKRDR